MVALYHGGGTTTAHSCTGGTTVALCCRASVTKAHGCLGGATVAPPLAEKGRKGHGGRETRRELHNLLVSR